MVGMGRSHVFFICIHVCFVARTLSTVHCFCAAAGAVRCAALWNMQLVFEGSGLAAATRRVEVWVGWS